ncbi:hypothetical protein K1719_045483 [Acacia pycnantha]|nr:hypothetical protein K1719_045483 [Acacia pycnantha]
MGSLAWNNTNMSTDKYALLALKYCITLDPYDFLANCLSGGIPNEIGHLSQLKMLYLGANQLAGSIPSSIFNNSVLQEIQLEGNQLSGSVYPQYLIVKRRTFLL